LQALGDRMARSGRAAKGLFASASGRSPRILAALSILLSASLISGFSLAQSPEAGAASTKGSGYDLVGSDGGVFVFPTGNPGGFYGSLPGLGVTPNKPVVGMVPTVTDKGYFLVAQDGGVFSFGTAPFLGSLPGLHVTPSQPIAGIIAADTDRGYFLVGKDGGVFAFGTVPFLGSLPGRGISVDNIIGIASTPSGNGYWLVSATGTVYGFGAAQSLGTAKGSASPVSAIAGTPTGGGYWITTQNGTVYAFGNAKKPSPGTLPAIGVSPVRPVIGIVHTADTAGYWLIGSDGGIFAFGDAPFVGSLPGLTVHVTNVVGAVPTSWTHTPTPPVPTIPVLTSITPSAGKTAGGTTVTLTGTGFTAGAGVAFGTGHPGKTVDVVSTSKITVKTPAHAAGTVTVTVGTATGVSNPKKYTFDPVPSITSLTPTAGATKGGTSVTVNGTGFIAGA